MSTTTFAAAQTRLAGVELSSCSGSANVISFAPAHTAPVIQRLREYNLQSVYLRLLFLGNAKRGGPSHTVLVTDVPFVTEVSGRGAELGSSGACGAGPPYVLAGGCGHDWTDSDMMASRDRGSLHLCEHVPSPAGGGIRPAC